MKTRILFTILASIFTSVNVWGQCNAPSITGFSPNTGYIGSTVTITGANFSTTPSNNQVFFGATQATVTSASFSSLTVTVPVGATTALISVRNNCNLISYSQVPFNGIFCPTPLTSTTYQNTEYTVSPAKGAYNMQCYDLDLDGKPDVISGGYTSTGFTIARNTSTAGTLSFSSNTVATTYAARQQVMVDFDGDGRLDIAYSGNGLNVLRNLSSPGTISFGSDNSIATGLGSYQIAAGDFNNDGKIDVVVTSGALVRTFRNTSTGPGNISFSANTSVNVGTTCTGLQCADVDGDGLTDILGSQGGANRAVSIRNTNTSNNSTFSFETPEYWASGGSYPYRCQIADFDKDGKIDLTTCNYSGSTNTAVFRNTSTIGNISFATVFTMVAPGGNYRIQVGDVNGDGLPDIVTKSLSSNVFSVYRNTSSGSGNISFATRIDYTSSAQAEVSGIVIGDLDGDFVPDIATSGINSNTIRFHRNTSSQNDNTAPTAICKNITVALSPSGSVNVTAAMINNGSSDACGVDTLAIDGKRFVTFDCSDTGENSVVLTVRDRAGNTSTCTATVTVNAAAVLVSGQTTVCQGQTVPMSANLGDSYQWYKNDTAITGATQQNYTATVSGSYKVEVANSGGCSGISESVSVTVNNNPVVSVVPTDTAHLCNGQLLLSASNSSLYQWRLNGNNIAGATQQTYTATATGAYSVKVVDLFGCSATSSNVTVTNNKPDVNIIGNSNAIASGDVTPSTTDGTDFGTTGSSTSTFEIENNGTGPLLVNSITIGGSNPSFFSLSGISLPTVISAGGSKSFDIQFSLNTISVKTASVSISTNDCDTPTYSFAIVGELSCTTPAFTTCPSNIETGTSLTTCDKAVSYTVATSGTPAPSVSYSYSGATTGSGTGDGSGSFFNKGTTAVTLSATNTCGTVTCSFNVVVVDDVDPVVVTENITRTLSNGAVTITAEDIDNGSTDNCEIESISVSPTSFDCSDIGENTVTLTVTDVNGNEATATATVTIVGTIPTVSIAPTTAEFCKGSFVTITATGSESGTYLWGNAATTASIDASQAGTYSVTFTNGNGCTATASQTVIENANPLANAGADVNIYYGYTPWASDTLFGSASSGTSPYTYSWNTGSSSSSIIVSPTSTTTYTLTVTDAKGCKGTDMVTANVQDVRCGKKMDKVLMCHNTNSKTNPTQEICVDENAVASHLNNHGDKVGSCSFSWGDPLDLGTTATVTVSPNPVTSSSSVSFYIPTDDDITVKLYNSSGTLLSTIYNGSARSGNLYNYSLDYSLFSYTGTYYIKLVSSTESVTVSVLKN